MATRFDYFGFEYEILEDKQNEVALIEASKAHGKVFIPKEVEYEGKQYAVTKIGSKKVMVEKCVGGIKETDGRKKNFWKVEPHWEKDYETYKGPFTTFNSRGKEWYQIYGTNTSITAIVLPDTIREFGFGAFRMCDSLIEINIPKGLSKIDDRVFSGCASLQQITLPNGITSIGKYAFIGCGTLHEITIPTSVKSIDEHAFGDSDRSKCGLEVVNILNEEGNIIIHPVAFTSRVKINYIGSKAQKNEVHGASSPTKSSSIDLEKLIAAALVDGVVTDKERAILCKKVKEAGGNVDEFEMLLDARIYEAQQKAQPAAPKKEEPKQEPKKDGPKPAPAKPASASSADGKMTVAQLAAEFKAQFGSVLRIYNGRSKADDSLSLQEVGLTGNLALSFDDNQKVGDFIAQMAQVGLKVKVYTCDEWVAVLDGLTLEASGKVKKNAVKADMESMIAYQRSDNSLGGYSIEAKEDGGFLVKKDGIECENAKAAMREIAAIVGLEVDPAWTTRQFGAKLLKALNK